MTLDTLFCCSAFVLPSLILRALHHCSLLELGSSRSRFVHFQFKSPNSSFHSIPDSLRRDDSADTVTTATGALQKRKHIKTNPLGRQKESLQAFFVAQCCHLAAGLLHSVVTFRASSCHARAHLDLLLFDFLFILFFSLPSCSSYFCNANVHSLLSRGDRKLE